MQRTAFACADRLPVVTGAQDHRPLLRSPNSEASTPKAKTNFLFSLHPHAHTCRRLRQAHRGAGTLRQPILVNLADGTGPIVVEKGFHIIVNFRRALLPGHEL